jgi:transposase-like protein
MARQLKKHSEETRKTATDRAARGESVIQIGKDMGIHPSLIYQWRGQVKAKKNKAAKAKVNIPKPKFKFTGSLDKPTGASFEDEITFLRAQNKTLTNIIQNIVTGGQA